MVIAANVIDISFLQLRVVSQSLRYKIILHTQNETNHDTY